MLKKHSVTIAGHRTSLTLEDAFWHELKEHAAQRDISLNELVTRIDSGRDLADNLCSVLRVYVLDLVKSRHTSADKNVDDDPVTIQTERA